jgi:hypothetical protein
MSAHQMTLRGILRAAMLLTGLLLVASAVPPMMRAMAAGQSNIAIDVSGAQPRQVEDATQQAVSKAYADAWKSLSSALANDDEGALDANFVGDAREHFGAKIDAQKKSGVKTRMIDHGHKAQAVFYSPEGSALELKDVADLEIQTLDGANVVHSETVKQPYLVLMSVVGDRWKVRVLQQTK